MKIPFSKVIESNYCRLRCIALSDLPAIFEASRFPGFTDGMTWDPPAHVDDLLPHHETALNLWEQDAAYVFSIDSVDADEFVGRISVRKGGGPGVWSIGFWTHPDRQGEGFMSEAVRLILGFAFGDLGADHVTAGCAHWNEASGKVLTKNGFEFVCAEPDGFSKNGKFVPMNCYEIHRISWNLRQMATRVMVEEV